MAKGCPGCGPVPWGSFPSGTWYHNGSPCPYCPLKITTSAGALVNFLKLGFQEMLKAIVWKMF